jgi:hypothetical protein
MRSLKSYLTRFLRFLRGEGVTTDRGQFKRFLTILGLAAVLGALLAPLAIIVTQPRANGSGTALAGTPTPKPRTTLPPTTPTSTPGQPTKSGLPVKGLTDNPAYQWWQWPNHAQPDSWWGDGQNAQTLGAQVSLMQELGVKLFRIELPWPFVAPAMPGGASYDSAAARDPNWSGYQWTRFDLIVQLTSQAGIQLVPQVVYTPDWASGVTTTTSGGPNQPPQSAAYFGDFVTAAATRYKDQIHYWEMWNEPDGANYWHGTMQQYVTLVLAPGYQAVKKIDPLAQVLIGGLAGDTNMAKYYAAGAQPYFDIGNFHAYLPEGGAAAAMDHVRGAMNQNGDQSKPLWLTEFGYRTQPDEQPCGPDTAAASSGETAQAKLIQGVYKDFKLQAILFYQLHDSAVNTSAGCGKQVYWGLVSHDLTYRKSGFDAYKNAVGGPLPALAQPAPALSASATTVCAASAFSQPGGGTV